MMRLWGWTDHGIIVNDVPVLGGMEMVSGLLGEGIENFHVAIADNGVRRSYVNKLEALGASITTVIDPTAVLAPQIKIGEGCFVGASSVINVGSGLGRGVIANTGAIIEHDCNVGDFSHIAPGSCLTGNCSTGECVLLGAGAVVIPRMVIERHKTIGAGAVVTRNVPKNAIVNGNPAC